MSDKDVKINISADAKGVKPGTDEARRAIDDLTGKVNGIPPAYNKAAAATATFTVKGAALAAAVGLVSTGIIAVGVAALAYTAHAAMAGIETVKLANEMANLSSRTGLSVEHLSSMRFVMEQNNATMTDYASGMKILSSRIYDAANGNKAALATFQALGISQQYLRDNINNGDAVFLRLADRFSQMKDGAGKNALANDVLGGSYQALLPTLNSGAEGIRQLAEEGDKWGVISADLAEKSRELGDNWAALKFYAKGVGVDVANYFLPALVDITRETRAAANEGGLLNAVWTALGVTFSKTFGLKSTRLEFADAQANDLFNQVTEAQTALDKLASIKGKSTGKDPDWLSGEMDKAAARVANLKKELKDTISARDKLLTKPVEAPKIDAPYKPGKSDLGKEYESATKAAEKYIATLEKETEQTGLDVIQKKMLEASIKALAAPTDALAMKIMTQAAAWAKATLAEKEKLAYDKQMNRALDEAIKQQDEMVKAYDKRMESNERLNESLQGELELLGMAERDRAIEVEMRKLSADATEDQANAVKKLAGALYDEKKAHKAIEDAQKAYEKMNDEINRGLTDALMRGFESGKDFASNFKDSLVNMFKTLVLRPIISATLAPVSGMMAGMSGSAQAGGTDYLGMASNASTVNSGYNYLTGYADSAKGYVTPYGSFGTSAANVTGSNMVMAGSAQEAQLASQWAGGGYETATGATGALAYGGAAAGAVYGYQEHGIGGAAVYGTAGYAAGAGAASAMAGGSAMAGASAALAAIPVWGWVALAALAIFGWDKGGAGAPKVNINTLFKGTGEGADQLAQAYSGTTDLGGKEELTGAIYNSDIAAIVAKYSPDNEYTGYLGGHINVQGDSENQNFAYINTLGRALENVNETGAGVVYNNQNPSSGQGVEDWQKWAETEIPRLQLAIVTDSMRTAGGDIGDIATSIVGTTLTDLTGAINAMTEEELGKALGSLYTASKFEFDRFSDLFGETFDLAGFDALSKEGENIVDTIVRLGDVFKVTNDIAEMLGQDTTTAFGEVGLASEAMRQSLIDAAGGMDALVSRTTFFYQSFYSESERAAREAEYAGKLVADAFAEMGIAVPDTSASFRGLVEGLDLGTAAGQSMYQSLMMVAPAFSAVTNAATAASADLARITSKQRNLDIELMDAQGNSAGALAARREDEIAALAATENATEDQIARLVSTQKAIYAAADAYANQQAAADQATQAAQQAQEAADQLRSTWQSVTDSIFDEVYRIRGLMGEQTTANIEAQFAISTAQARAGDRAAAELLPSLSRSLLDAYSRSASTALDLAQAQAQTATSLEETGSTLATRYGISIPSYDIGTNYVPRDMLALIHEGEAIIPRAYNPDAVGQNNDEIVAELRALQAAVASLKTSAAETAATNQKISDLLLRVTRDGESMVTVPA